MSRCQHHEPSLQAPTPPARCRRAGRAAPAAPSRMCRWGPRCGRPAACFWPPLIQPTPRRAALHGALSADPRCTRPRRLDHPLQGLTLKQHIEHTLGTGSIEDAVRLPAGEDLNEWLAVNVVSQCSVICCRQIMRVGDSPICVCGRWERGVAPQQRS